MSYTCGETVTDKESCDTLIAAIPNDANDPNYAAAVTAAVNAGATAVSDMSGGKRRRKTMKKMSKRKMMKWCKSKKNRRTKAGRKMCKKMKK